MAARIRFATYASSMKVDMRFSDKLRYSAPSACKEKEEEQEEEEMAQFTLQ